MRAAAGQALTPAEAFAFLLGRWRLEREVTGQALIAGELEVARSGVNEAVYCERVAVRMAGGATFSGSQSYQVRPAAAGFVLCFAETGAVFQEVEFACASDGRLEAQAVHVCGADRYESAYVLGPGREFWVQHRVCGPRKAYMSETRFVAVGEPTDTASEI